VGPDFARAPGPFLSREYNLTNLEIEMHLKMLMYGQNDASIRHMLREMEGREPTEEEFTHAKAIIENIDGMRIEATNEYSLELGAIGERENIVR